MSLSVLFYVDVCLQIRYARRLTVLLSAIFTYRFCVDDLWHADNPYLTAHISMLPVQEKVSFLCHVPY